MADLSAPHAAIGPREKGPLGRFEYRLALALAEDLRGLFIVDGSTVPGPPGVNPQLTIVAMATRAAEKIAERI
jgi:GMC oxidoreductase